MFLLAPYRRQIEAALKHSGGTHTYEDVAAMVVAGKMQAWPNGDSIAITEVICYPRKKVLNVFLAAGNRTDLTDMIDAAAAWGRSQGCTSMAQIGRHGWTRVLGKFGWKATSTVMERSI